jgi:cytosine/adenosine deaminase-related metal-dependent hydrolase
VTVALGNDGPPCNNTLDPVSEIGEASLLSTVDALDATALHVATVLEMATRAAGFERVGARREGWRADLVGLEFGTARTTPVHDPPSSLVYAARGDDVALTMVDGDVLSADGVTGPSTRGLFVRERGLSPTISPG